MAGLSRIRQIFSLALVVLAALDTVLVAYLLWPGPSNASRRKEEQALQAELAGKTREEAPLQGMDKKLLQTRADIEKLYGGRLPSRYSEISEQLDKLARDNGVSKGAIVYKAGDAGIADLQLVDIETTISGDYAKIARFINAMERDRLIFVVRQIALSGQTGTVQLQIKFQTFLKEAA